MVAVPVAVLAGGAGVALLWSAFTGQNPLTELRKALTAGKLDGPEAGGKPLELATVDGSTSSTPAGSSTAGPFAPSGQAPAVTTGGRPQLAPLGQGNHQLQPAAVLAFKRVEAAFGRSIPITDSVRSWDQQSAAYASDPRRFGKPEGNKHVMGLAVDVNLPAIGAKPNGSNPRDWLRDSTYAKLHQAMTANGWCNYQIARGNTGGKIPEPWHYSYGGCG